jgi:hypothetical protein
MLLQRPDETLSVIENLKIVYDKISNRSVYTNHHDFIRQKYDMSRSEVAQYPATELELYSCAILQALDSAYQWLKLDEQEFTFVKSVFEIAINHRDHFTENALK